MVEKLLNEAIVCHYVKQVLLNIYFVKENDLNPGSRNNQLRLAREGYRIINEVSSDFFLLLAYQEML